MLIEIIELDTGYICGFWKMESGTKFTDFPARILLDQWLQGSEKLKSGKWVSMQYK